MIRIRSSCLQILAVHCTMAAIGCSGSPDGIVPVEGTVTLDGQPLPGAQVKFQPPDGTLDNIAIGFTDQEGRFSMHLLGTLEPGVAPGVYEVSFTTAVAGPDDLETDPIPKERVPPKFRNGGLEFEVLPEGDQTASFELVSK